MLRLRCPGFSLWLGKAISGSLAQSAYQSVCLPCRMGCSQPHKSYCTWGCCLPRPCTGAGSHSRGARREGWSRVCSLGGQVERRMSANHPYGGPWRPEEIGVMTSGNSSYPEVYNLRLFFYLLLSLPWRGLGYLSTLFFSPALLISILNLRFIMENETIMIHCL